jgi:hypothetical protein
MAYLFHPTSEPAAAIAPRNAVLQDRAESEDEQSVAESTTIAAVLAESADAFEAVGVPQMKG